MRLVQKSGTICAGIQRRTRVEIIVESGQMPHGFLDLGLPRRPNDPKAVTQAYNIRPCRSDGDATAASLRPTLSQLS